jgi:hypothetical protein
MMKRMHYAAFVLMAMVFTYCRPVFYDDDFKNKPITYPHEFRYSTIRQTPPNVYLNQNGILTPMSRTQLTNSVFGTFWDKMPSYASFETAKLPFNGVEILDDTRMRLFNTDTKFNTTVRYSRSGDLEYRFEVNYQFNAQEHIYAGISNYTKPQITFYPHWLLYTYRPFLQDREYAPLELAMLNPPFLEFSWFLHFQSAYGSDFGHLDTVGVQQANITFE